MRQIPSGLLSAPETSHLQENSPVNAGVTGAPLVNGHTAPLPERASAWTVPKISVYQHSIHLEPARPLVRETRPGGGIRGEIEGFSYKAQLRLMRAVHQIRTDAYAMMGFTTLTYHLNWEGRDIKGDLDRLMKRARRKFGKEFAYLWRLDPQRRGAPHYHVLIFFPEISDYADEEIQAWFSANWTAIADPGNPWHLKHGAKTAIFTDAFEGVSVYTAKYCAKATQSGIAMDNFRGRWWGTSPNLDMSPVDEIELTTEADSGVRRAGKRWLEGQESERARRYAEVLTGDCSAVIMFRDSQREFGNKLADYAKKLNAQDPPPPEQTRKDDLKKALDAQWGPAKKRLAKRFKWRLKPEVRKTVFAEDVENNAYS